MKRLRFRILAPFAALPILLGLLLLGLLVPAVALPCAGGDPMSCDVCLVGILPGTPVCASACQAVPAPEAAVGTSSPGGTLAWFVDFVIRPYGFHPSPDFPPPR
jgi:hypothetical protein